MRLVNDDRETPVALRAADLVEDERKLLDRRDDDLLAGLKELAQISGFLRMSHGRPDMGVLLDRVPDLPIEKHPIRDHDDGVE